jgi:UDP-N-acetylglucosamine acyltransferase
MAIVGGCSRIAQDVAPFMLVEGNPAETRMVNKIGLERNGVPAEAQAALRQAHKILFREGLTTSNALARIEQEVALLAEIQYLVQFVRTSERGVIK